MISSDVIRGYNDLIILSLLLDGPSYGYAISRQIRTISQDKYVIKETTLYSAFNRLQKQGFIESFSDLSPQGRQRTYYRITGPGQDYYKDKCEEWALTKHVINQFIVEKLLMDAIRSYIENVFANLPKTNEVLRAKSDMLDNMEEKYREFKDQGYSENEAVGKVISEFGNMDELIAELDVRPATPAFSGKKAYQVSKKEAEDWVNTKKRMGLLIAVGVFLCIFGVILLLLKTAVPYTVDLQPLRFLGGPSPAVGITLLLSMVAIAVGLFIFSGMKLDRFDFMDKGF